MKKSKNKKKKTKKKVIKGQPKVEEVVVIQEEKTFKEKLTLHFKKYMQPYIIGVVLTVWFFLLILLATVGKNPPYSSVALDFGNIQIAWYAVFILTGAMFAIILAMREAYFLDVNRDHLFDAAMIGLIVGIVGGRLYYVIFHPVGGFLEIFNIRGGGLAIHGVVIASLIFAYIYTKVRKMSFLGLMDMLAVGFLIAQVVGRWGNFFNQEAHGGPMSAGAQNFLSTILPSFIFENMNIGGIYYHPTFLYEGIWNFIGFVALLIIRRKRIFKLGDLIGVYLIWYGLGRGLLIEPFREDALLFFINANPTSFILDMLNRVNVVFSLTLFTIGGVLFIYIKNKLNPDLPYYLDVVKENEEEALYLLSKEGRKEVKQKKKEGK